MNVKSPSSLTKVKSFPTIAIPRVASQNSI
jgi:hypothetical protein